MSIESNLKKLLKGEKACYPEEFLKVPSYNSPTLRTGKGRPISEGQFGKMYRGSINNDGKRYVAYKEIDTSDSTDGAFEFEFKVAQKLKEFAVPDVYLFKKCPIQDKTPQKIRKGGKPGSKMGHWLVVPKRKKPKDILYMELLDAQPFHSWFETNPSLDAMKSVILQVFDNLYRINQKYPDFRHRDLHGGNIMVGSNKLVTSYTWKVDLGRKVIRNDPGGSFRSRVGSPDIKHYKRTNAGVEATIIDFGLSYWSRSMPNPETASGGYKGAGIHGTFPGTIRYDTHRFLYIIYAKVRQPQNSKERAIKNFIEELVPNKRYFDFNGPFTSQGYLVNDAWAMQNLPSFKTILSHPFLTGEKMPNRPKTLANALGMIPKAKTPVKVKTPPKARTKTPSPKLSTAERKKKMNSAIKKAAAVLAANKNKAKAKPPQRRPGVVRPVTEIKTATPTPKANAPYGVMSPSNIMNLAKEIENGRKKAANKLNAKLAAIKATKGKTPTPVRLKQRYTFTDIKGKKREFVRKFAYDRALAKNKAERERRAQPTWSEKARMKRSERGQPFNMKTPQNVRNAIKAGKNMKFVQGRFKTVTPKAKTFVNKFVNALDKDELNALKKKIC
jgi:serine/threonine protein kinase